MSINQKDVELLIRARNLSSQPLKEVTDSVNAVTQALGEQIKAAERGDISASELNETLKQLKKSEDALVQQSALIDRMRTLAQQLEAAEANADKAKASLANFADTSAQSAESISALQGSLSKAEQKAQAAASRLVEFKKELGDTAPTDKQAAQLAKLSMAYEKAATSAQAYLEKAAARAQTAVGTRQNAVTAQSTRLSGIGVSSTPEGLDTASQAVYGGVAQTSAGIQQIEDAQAGLTAARRANMEATANAAAVEKAYQDALAQSQAAADKAAAEEKAFYAERDANLRKYQTSMYAALFDEIDAREKAEAAMQRELEAEKAFYAQRDANMRKFTQAEYEQVFAQAEATKAAQMEAKATEASNGVRERLIQFLNTERGARIQDAEAARQEAAAKQAETEAEKQNADARETSRSSLNLFNNDSRESLSLYQRIRGQILGVTAAYIGLQGAVDLARGALEALVDKQAAENRLAIVVGNDPKAIAAEYGYVHDQAVRLGMGIKEMADAYSNFAIAAKNGNMSLEQTRYAFERITEAMRVNHASSDAVNGAFTQLEQMLSKNKVQMDDLRQASSWIPGMEAMMARGLANQGFSGFDQLTGTLEKMKTAQPEQRVAVLFKAMKEGSVDAKTAILALSEELERTYKDRLPDALKSLQAEQGRLNTAFFDFKLAIADSGFADAATRLFERLTAALKGPEGAEMAKNLSDGFSKIADAAIFLIDHLDDLMTILKLLVELKAFEWSMSLASGFKTATEAVIEFASKNLVLDNSMTTLVPSFKNVEMGAGALNKGLFAIRATLMAVGAAIAGWEIGTWLREKFDTVRLAGIALVSGLMDLWTNLKYGVQVGIEGFVFAISVALDKIQTKIENVIVGMAKLNPLASADSINKLQDETTKAQAKRSTDIDARAKSIADLGAARDAELNKRHDSFADSWDYEAAGGDKAAAARAAAAQAASPPSATTSPGDFGKPGLGLDDKDKTANERATMEQALADQLRSIDAKIERQQKDSLDARLKAVDDTYQRIYDKLDKFQKIGGKSIKVTDENGQDRVFSIDQYKQQLELQTQLLKQQETEKFNKEELKTLEDDLNKLVAERKDRLSAITDDLKTGAIDSTEAFKRTSAVFDEMNPKISDAAKKAKDFANSAVGKGVTASQASAFGAKADNASDDDTVERKQTLSLLADGEARVNDLLNQRKAIIEANNALVKLGLMTQRDADAMLEKENGKLGPEIKKQADELLAVMKSMHDQGKLSDEDFELWSAKIGAAKAQSVQLSESMTWTKNFLDQSAVKGAQTFFQGIADGIAGIVTGTKSWAEAWQDLRDAMLKYFADLLMQLGLEIIKRQILNALGSSGDNGSAGSSGSSTSWVSTAASLIAAMFHGGGTVGSSNTMSRAASPSWFVNAPRYHSGGLPGLAPDEQAAILKKGEEVLTGDDPRNVLNGGKTAGAQTAANPQDIKIINSIDSHSVLQQALSTKDGTKLVLNMLYANRSQLRALLNN